MRLPGFEPGLQAWEAYVITTGPQPLAHLKVSSLIKRLWLGDFTPRGNLHHRAYLEPLTQDWFTRFSIGIKYMRSKLNVDWSRETKKNDLPPALSKYEHYLVSLGFRDLRIAV